MRSFQSFFHEHNSEWSEAERDARWREAATKSGERRAYRRNLRSNILIPFSGERIEAREEGRTAMEVRFDSLRRRRGSENDAPFWSLGMVVAWVMWRDFGRVTEMERDPFASDTTLCLRASLDAIMGVRFAEASTKKAFLEISVAAQKGQLSFTGIALNSDQKTIKAEEWVHFAQPNAEYTKMKRKDGREVYRDLYAGREAILTLWPALEAWRAPLPDAGLCSGARPQSGTETTVRANSLQVGRPRIQDELLRSYEKLFPHGHAKSPWKAVAQAIEVDTGEKFHIDTLKRALGLRGEAAAKIRN